MQNKNENMYENETIEPRSYTQRSFDSDNMDAQKNEFRQQKEPIIFLGLEQAPDHPPTSYLETLVHLFKGNIGPGLFAMGIAFKNGGLIQGALLTFVIGVICVHCQHILVRCSEKMTEARQEFECADYADTVQQCFESGPVKLRSWSKPMRAITNIFICFTQLGFCCIYFVFISTNARQIFKAYNIDIDFHLVLLMAFVPIWLFSLIMNLKWLMPVSLVASICMVGGLTVTMYYALKDGLPNPSERHYYTNVQQLALFFGTAIFAFEGITLVLPLRNSMKKPQNFSNIFGVLNVGMVIVGALFIFTGLVGYLKYGENVGGSLTLNLGDTILAQCVKGIVSMGVLLGYPLQFFIAIQIMWPNVIKMLHMQQRPFTGELMFRTLMVLVTLGVAEIVPALSLFISLIGSLCSTALALVFPPVLELLMRDDKNKGPGCLVVLKNIFILIFALLGFFIGTFQAIYEIIEHFGKEEEVK